MLYSPSVAFLTGSVGTGEWIVLFVVVLIVVGPKRLPEIARKIGLYDGDVPSCGRMNFKEQLMSMDQEPNVPSEPSYGDDYTDPYADTDTADYPGYEDHDAGSGSGVEGDADDGIGSVDDSGEDGNTVAAFDGEAEDPPKASEGGA